MFVYNISCIKNTEYDLNILIKESEQALYEPEEPDKIIESLNFDSLEFNVEENKPSTPEMKIGFSLADSIKGLFKNEKTPQEIKREQELLNNAENPLYKQLEFVRVIELTNLVAPAGSNSQNHEDGVEQCRNSTRLEQGSQEGHGAA